jgi:Flp pilus assembly protein TadG
MRIRTRTSTRRTDPRTRARSRRARGDRGQMAVEMVLMTPVMVAFLLLVVACGRYVMVRGEVEAASRDAARAASLARDPGDATADAESTAEGSLSGDRATCDPVQLDLTDFVAGGTVTARLTCRVDLSDLGLLGLPGSVKVQATSAAPLDLYRRTA